MVAPKMFFETFSRHFPRSGKLIIDVQDKSSIDLAGFRKKVRSVYRYFSALPHSPGDKVILFLENSIDHMAVLLALFDVDLVLVPLNPRLNRAKTAYLVRHSRSKWLITSQAIFDRNEWLQELPCRTILMDEIFRFAPEPGEASRAILQYQPRKEDLKFILYTSGTIGNPKGVMLSRESVRMKISNLIDLLNFRPGTAFFSFLPFFSGHGMIPGMLVPFLSGCRMHIARFDPFLGVQFWNVVKKYRIHCFTAVPGILALLKEHIGGFRKKNLKCLRTVFSASSQLPQAVYDWYAGHLGIYIRNCYGLTETASWISVNKDAGKGEKAHCVGKPLGADIGVFDGKGRRLRPNETGEFRVKSPYNMLGYFRNQRETRSCMAEGGFLKTGDTGSIDPKGKIFFLDRIKQIIIKNGINVYPLEIDQAFLEHPDIKDSVSFGVPDERYGEAIITALRVRDSKGSKKKYYRHAMKKLPAFLVPQDIFFPKDLPRGVTGKVKVESLRKQYLEKRK
ncbi:MAG: class I adenylate-forming enzyme family protein [Candidatus Omnitrophota bacterium]